MLAFVAVYNYEGIECLVSSHLTRLIARLYVHLTFTTSPHAMLDSSTRIQCYSLNRAVNGKLQMELIPNHFKEDCSAYA